MDVGEESIMGVAELSDGAQQSDENIAIPLLGDYMWEASLRIACDASRWFRVLCNRAKSL